MASYFLTSPNLYAIVYNFLLRFSSPPRTVLPVFQHPSQWAIPWDFESTTLFFQDVFLLNLFLGFALSLSHFPELRNSLTFESPVLGFSQLPAKNQDPFLNLAFSQVGSILLDYLPLH